MYNHIPVAIVITGNQHSWTVQTSSSVYDTTLTLHFWRNAFR
jgi:hypothetical protein